jgi:hypothetical protein
LDPSAADLRDAAAQTTRKRRGERRRLPRRDSAAEACSIDRLCDSVRRYNELELQDLFDRPRRTGPVIAPSGGLS